MAIFDVRDKEERGKTRVKGRRLRLYVDALTEKGRQEGLVPQIHQLFVIVGHIVTKYGTQGKERKSEIGKGE